MKKTIFFCSHIAERSLAPVQKQIFDALLSEITHIGNCIQRATIASVLLKNFNDDLTIALVKILPTKDRSIAVEPRALTDLGLSALPSTLPDGGHAWVEIGTKDGSSFVYDPWLNPTVIYGVVEHQVLLKIRDCHFGLLRRDEITEDFCMQFNIAKKMMQHNSPGLIGLFSDPKMPFETFQSSLSVLSQKQSKIRPFSGSAGFLAACALGNWAAAMTLLLSGVDPDYKDLKQRGASHYVAMRRGVTGLFLEVYEYHYGHAPTDIDIKKCMEGRAFVLKQLLYLDVSFSIENVTGNSAESLIFAQKTKFSAPGEEKDCAYFTAFEAGLQDCRARLEVVKSREIDEASAGAGSSALRCSFLEQFGLNHPGATFPKALDLD
ncbi:MAG: hypothetical protein NTV32_07415 [Gammaproteobacteria bacterium]|nr:hypothetical protein [Gammaproteobacteria bacterium]